MRVRSTLGRFLEHSRIYEFTNGGTPEVWIGSADLMHRNLDRRIEVLARLNNSGHVRKLSELFDLAFDPGTSSWHLGPDGEWSRVHQGHDGQALRDIQDVLINRQVRRFGSAS